MRHDPLIEYLLATEHVILARDHRGLREPLARGVAEGRLARLLPGVYVDAGKVNDLVVRAAAITRWGS